MIKTTYANVVRIAAAMGFEYGNSYDTLLNTLRENNITVTTKAEPPGYILTFPTPNHEMLFRIKYAEILHPIPQFIQANTLTPIVYETK